jgi:hypothetical protein
MRIPIPPLIPANAGTQAFFTTKDTKFTKAFVSFVVDLASLFLGPGLRRDERGLWGLSCQ